MADNVLRLPEPVFLTLQSPSGETQCKVDVFIARRMLMDAEKQPTEEGRWAKVLQWLGEQLKIPPDQLAWNMAILFNNAVMELTNKLTPELAKEHFKTACLEDSIQVSRQATQTGPQS